MLSCVWMKASNIVTCKWVVPDTANLALRHSPGKYNLWNVTVISAQDTPSFLSNSVSLVWRSTSSTTLPFCSFCMWLMCLTSSHHTALIVIHMQMTRSHPSKFTRALRSSRQRPRSSTAMICIDWLHPATTGADISRTVELRYVWAVSVEQSLPPALRNYSLPVGHLLSNKCNVM